MEMLGLCQLRKVAVSMLHGVKWVSYNMALSSIPCPGGPTESAQRLWRWPHSSGWALHCQVQMLRRLQPETPRTKWDLQNVDWLQQYTSVLVLALRAL